MNNETEITTDKLVSIIGIKEIEIQVLKERLATNMNMNAELIEKVKKLETKESTK